VPQWTYISDVQTSPRDANTVFVALNNWQRGDYKPYLVKSTDRGRTWTSLAGDLPDRHDVWAVAQDHINANLLFVGTEFGVFVTVDGGAHWTPLKGGMPVAQVRDLTIQRRENDLVVATFGRGFYILDDYSPLREMTTATLSEDAHLYALRDAYLFNLIGQAPAGAAGLGTMAGNWTTANPPYGAVFTFSLRNDVPADAKLVMTITDESGKQIRRFDVAKGTGLRRVAWNLRADPPVAAGRGQRGDAGGAGAAGAAGREGGAANPAGARGDDQAAAPPPPQAGGGRGQPQGALVAPGRYRAQLGRQVGADVTPLGAPQSFTVVTAEPRR
jgi:hypothetical protein